MDDSDVSTPKQKAARAVAYPPLANETRARIDTNCLAYHLNRKPQTIRTWVMNDTVPKELEPKQIHNRWTFLTAGVKRLQGVE